MTFGLRVTNTFSTSLIDADFSNARVTHAYWVPITTSAYTVLSPLPFTTSEEPPMVFVRPVSAEKWIGGVSIAQPNIYTNEFGAAVPYSRLVIYSEGSFDMVLCYSKKGTAISEASSHGMKVFRADGSMAFSSLEKHPQVTHLLYKPPVVGVYRGGYPYTFNITGHSERPWFLASQLLTTGRNQYDEAPPGAIFAKVNAANTQITYDNRMFYSSATVTEPYGFDVSPGVEGPANATDTDPYQGTSCYFAVSKLNI